MENNLLGVTQLRGWGRILGSRLPRWSRYSPVSRDLVSPVTPSHRPSDIHTRLLISGFPLYRPQLPRQLLSNLKADFKCPLLRKDVLNCSQTRVVPLLSIPNVYFPAGLFSIETHRACSWASFVAQLVKNLPAMQESWVRSLGWEDPLEKGKATHSIAWPGEFHGL